MFAKLFGVSFNRRIEESNILSLYHGIIPSYTDIMTFDVANKQHMLE